MSMLDYMTIEQMYERRGHACLDDLPSQLRYDDEYNEALVEDSILAQGAPFGDQAGDILIRVYRYKKVLAELMSLTDRHIHSHPHATPQV